jgi:acetamidase/formamidase
VVRVKVLKNIKLDGPVLLPLVDDLPYLVRPFTAEERQTAAELAARHATPLEGPRLPIQVVGSGAFLNAAVDNGIERTASLLGMSVAEVRNRSTISGAVEIGRLPGLVQINLLAPVQSLSEAGILATVEAAYGASA